MEIVHDGQFDLCSDKVFYLCMDFFVLKILMVVVYDLAFWFLLFLGLFNDNTTCLGTFF